MGTKIFESKCGRLQVKRFYGGEERGVCYQINVGTHYIQITESQFNEFIQTLRPYESKEDKE